MDRYIDNQETQTYGPKLRQNLERAFEGSPKEVRAFLAWLGKQQSAVDARMASGMARAIGSVSDLSKSAESKSPATDAARALLVGFHQHLESKRGLGEWTGDLKVFFPTGRKGVGRSGHAVATALATALAGFAKDKKVPDAKKLRARLAAADKTLRAELAKSGGAVAAARKGLSEQSAEKKAWLAVYRGIALVVEGVLTLEGRPKALRTVVPHLAVSGGRAKPKAPKGTSGGPVSPG